MSFSTPTTKRSSTSTSIAGTQESDYVKSSRQFNLKDMLNEDLARARWKLEAPHLARALSSKTLKDNAEPIKEIDHISRYDVLIDNALDGVLLQAAEMLTVPTIADISKTKGHPKSGLDPKPEGDTKREKNTTNERDHYDYLAKFLNECLELCRRFFPHLVGEYYQNLTIGVYDRPTMDGISDAPPLKPDLVGTIGPFPKDRLWWADEKPGLGRTVLLPVEVKKTMSSDLVAQAATYGRALFSVAPFRQFALVLGYDHDAQSLYFLVFHCGGMTRSEALSVQDASGRKEILRLFLSILTWKTPGDAGFAEWFGGLGLFIPRYPGDTEGVFLHVMQMIFRKSTLVGRGQSVLRCMSPNDESSPSSLVPIVQTSGAVKYVPLANDPRTSSQARANSISESGSAVGESSAHPSLSSSRKRPSEHNTEHESTKKARLETNDFEPIVLRKDGGQPVYVPQKIGAEYASCNIRTDKALDLVLKFLWLPVGSGNVESKLLTACGGMFGVVEHYYSSALSHKPGILSTNHLFLPDEAKALGDTEGREKDRRVLWLLALNFAGESLVKASTPKMLITSIIHAILGYRNILFKGYQHRDISIGNVLFREEPVEKNDLLQDLKDTKAPHAIRELIMKLGISNECNGCVIDGDLAIRLTTYFSEERKASRSGTREFMSKVLLDSMTKDKPFFQSPMDDFFSFYFVAQWAAVFNDHEFTNPRHNIPLELLDFRKKLFKGGDARTAVTADVRDYRLKPSSYGHFLSKSKPFLSDWYQKLIDIYNNYWMPRLEDVQSPANSTLEYTKMFEELTDELVVGVLKIFDKHLPSLS